jgi:hypothetical protein
MTPEYDPCLRHAGAGIQGQDGRAEPARRMAGKYGDPEAGFGANQYCVADAAGKRCRAGDG